MSDIDYNSRPEPEFDNGDRHPSHSPRRSRDQSRSRSPAGGSTTDRRAPVYEDDEEVSNPGNQIYVRGLSFRTTDDELRDLFEKYGDLEEVNVVKDPHLNECRGFAFVKFVKSEDAEKAIRGEHDQTFHGRRLIVELSRRARPRPKTPGEYLGRLSSREMELRGERRRGSDRRREYDSRDRYDRDDRGARGDRGDRYDDRRMPSRYDDRDRRGYDDRRGGYDRRDYERDYDRRADRYDDRRGSSRY